MHMRKQVLPEDAKTDYASKRYILKSFKRLYIQRMFQEIIRMNNKNANNNDDYVDNILYKQKTNRSNSFKTLGF